MIDGDLEEFQEFRSGEIRKKPVKNSGIKKLGTRKNSEVCRRRKKYEKSAVRSTCH